MVVKIYICWVFVYGVTFGAQDTGYPAGLMADCPGMNRSTRFSDATRASLTVVVMKPTRSFLGSTERVCQLSSQGANCTAQFLDLRRRKTQIVISGYLDASFSPIVRSITGVYLNQGKNVIVVEIFPLLVRTYPLAARVTKPLGDHLGHYLAELTRRGLSPARLELVGGSLGAHIASFAAVKYHQITGKKPARLTGLDPAGPCFRNLPPSQRFRADAALRTDALHTNIDGFGIADAVAQVDFYANGGEFQPAMVGDFLLPCFLLCSHVRAAFYWAISYRHPDKFQAARCDTVAKARHGDCYGAGRVHSNLLGPKTNFSSPGIYYLQTTEVSPYFVDNGLARRDYDVNNYLLKTAPDDDVVV